MAKKTKAKAEKSAKELLELLKRVWGYANPEGSLNDGCIGCGAYPEGENHVMAHDDGCGWVELRDEIEAMGIKADYY
jgi:hypothetical protein